MSLFISSIAAISAGIPHPAAPSALTFQGSSPGSIALSWTQVDNADPAVSFNIYEGLVIVATSVTTSKIVTGLAAASTHTYTVKSVDAGGHESSTASNAVTGTTVQAALIWLDPSDTPTVSQSGGRATLITDLSGNGNDFAEGSLGAGPGYGSLKINGLDTLQSAMGWMKNSGVVIGTQKTFAGVAKILSVTSYNAMCGCAAFAPAMYVNHSGNPEIYWSGDHAFTDITYSVNDIKSLMFTVNGVSLRAFSNGVASGLNPLSGGTGVGATGLGLLSESATSQGSGGNTLLGEFLTFNAILSSTEIANLNRFLTFKWGPLT
jgi:hypothetical protein